MNVNPEKTLVQLTLRSSIPASCHFSPNSPPPLILAIARIAPYRCTNVSMYELKNGVTDIANPPYPAPKSHEISYRVCAMNGVRLLTILKCRCRPVELGILVADYKHWDPSPILTGVPNL